MPVNGYAGGRFCPVRRMFFICVSWCPSVGETDSASLFVPDFLSCRHGTTAWIPRFLSRTASAPDVWSADARQYIFDKWRATARRYGFREYDGPPLEPLELFTTKSGEEIVGQLYNFKDKGDRAVSLRPEMTPTLARMVAAHERSLQKPIKWFAIPQLFRYERQQKGRLREHFQFNADLIGESIRRRTRN
jgi:histidyl-tRNA synthetase